MSYHILNIDSPQCDLSCRRGQITFFSNGETRQLPIEDVAAVVITSYSARIHSPLLVEAARHGVAMIICEDFKPVSLMLPANRSSDTLLTKAALNLDKKKTANLWRKTVDAKCRNQFLLARHLNPEHPKLERLEKVARSRQPAKESAASRYYWPIYAEALDDSSFTRDPDGGGLNDLLNYGYAVLLSTVLQKLFAYGLDPTLGIAHAVRERSAPLAYDLMEPFRPCVDWRVAQWMRGHAGFQDYRITAEFRRWVTGFTVERAGYLGLKMDIRGCIEGVTRGFRQAVLHHNTRLYKAWSPTNSKWDGCS